MTYLKEVLPHRIVALERNLEDRVTFYTRFDYSKWCAHDYDDVADLLLPASRMFEAIVPEQLRANLQMFDRGARSDLQGIFDRTEIKHMLREIIACDARTQS